MDYEKAYKDALERARKCLDEKRDTCFVRPDVIFPELAESEDERISREITEFILTHRIDEPNDIEDTNSWLAWLEKQGEQIDKGEISDGYHTFNELYYYRMLYNAAFFNLLPKEWTHKSKRHHDGEECFGGGWFIVMANLPTGQISNHYELKDWDLFQIPEKEMADEWDGHTPQEAAERLHKYLEKQAPKTQGKTALEAIKEEKMDNANKVEPPQEIDGFDAELNALLKKYEHLPKEELVESLGFYFSVVRDGLDW